MEVLTVAMDAQGFDKPIHYIKPAKASFMTLVDEKNLLGQLYGFKVVPVCFLIDSKGVVSYKNIGNFDIRQPEMREHLDRWSSNETSLETLPDHDIPYGHSSEANILFQKGLSMHQSGKTNEAITLWKKSLKLDPDNYIIQLLLLIIEWSSKNTINTDPIIFPHQPKI